MTLKRWSGLVAGVCGLLIVTPPMARALVRTGDARIWQSLEKSMSTTPNASTPTAAPTAAAPIATPLAGDWQGLPARGAWNPRGPMMGPPDRHPSIEEGTAPVPEPGTLALASLGLLALGAATRRRRGAQLPGRLSNR